MRRQRLLLLGGGHAHLEVLRRFAVTPRHGVDVTLVTPHPLHRYSSSMPAALRGDAAEDDGSFALDALARAAGVQLLLGCAEEIEGGSAPRVRVGAEWIETDVISLDIGSAPSTSQAIGAATHAHHVRSYAAWQALRRATDAVFTQRAKHGSQGAITGASNVVVVGAGAGGVEIALAIAARARQSRVPVQVTLIEAQAALPTRGRARVVLQRLLEHAGVQCVFGARVVEVRDGAVRLDDGREVASSLTIWLAGAEPPQALRDSPTLPRSPGGFLRVTAMLQAVDGSPLFGAGDCVAVEGFQLDKAGVFAVREAPILAENLRAALARQRGVDETFRTYRPQRRYLSILDTSDGRALLTWGANAWHSKWALQLKRWLDDRFVARYRVTSEGGDARVHSDASSHARLRRVARALVAGAAMVAVVHQPLVWCAHRWLGTPWVAFSLAPTRPFGVPALLSAMAWGGAWVALLRPLWRARGGWSFETSERISLTRAVTTCALLPTVLGAILMTRSASFPPLGEHPWLAALAAVVINGAWGGASGAMLRVWRSGGGVPSSVSRRDAARRGW